MNSTIIALIVFGAVTIFAFLFAMSVSKNESLLKKRLNEFTDDQMDNNNYKGNVIDDLPFKSRVFTPYIIRMSNFMMKVTPKSRIDAVQEKIIMAGEPKGLTAATFLGIQGLLVVAFGIGFFFYFTILGASLFKALGFGLFACLIGYTLPKTSLDRKCKKRQEDIRKGLPFSLDLLTVSVDAGLGFDSAMDKVAETLDGPIAVEFERVLTEIRLGKPRKEALRNMIERTKVKELSEFVVAIIQADKLGVGLSKLLKVQAKQMRLNAKQRAQEKAQKAPVKMLFPMILFIFPSIFVILLGPAVMMIPELLGGL